MGQETDWAGLFPELATAKGCLLEITPPPQKLFKSTANPLVRRKMHTIRKHQLQVAINQCFKEKKKRVMMTRTHLSSLK
jgi:hypothetical protein